MMQREDRQPAQLAAAEQVNEAEEAAAVLVEELGEQVGIDARRRNVAAQAVNRQQPKREQNALAQIRNAKYIGQLLKHGTKTSSLREDLDLATGLFDLFLGRLGELMSPHGDRTGQLSLTQHLHQRLL